MILKIQKKDLDSIKNNGVGVLPTDTLYGLVGSAFSKKAVEKIFKLKKRGPKKPLIILISFLKDLELFNIKIDTQTKKILAKYWPGKVSVILPCSYKKLHYLHRGTNSLAFRLPKKPSLLRLLGKTGPLVAPSANPENLPPAKTITEAKKYFGDKVDFYINAGKLDSPPSKLIKITKNKTIERLRK